MNRPTRFLEFEARLDALLEEFRDVLGPKRCGLCPDADECPHAIDEGTQEAVPDVFVQDWALIHRWARMDGEGSHVDWLTSNRILTIEAIGLFVTVCDDARDRLRIQR